MTKKCKKYLDFYFRDKKIRPRILKHIKEITIAF